MQVSKWSKFAWGLYFFQMRKFFNIAAGLVLSILSVGMVSCSSQEVKVEKPKYLWMCTQPNFERFSSQDSIRFYLDKAKETGFNHIVVDVKGLESKVMYKSSIFPELQELDGVRCERDWDYLQFFIDEARKRGMGVTVSTAVFPIGSQYRKIGPVFENDSLKKYTCVEYLPEGMKKIEDDPSKVAVFLNPALPECQEYALSFLREILEKYEFDGLCLDYCRYPGPESDFSEETRALFEEYLGKEVGNFPQDIFTYNPDGTRNPGPYYKEWWEFRSMVIHDFIGKVRELIKEIQPDVQLEYWAASWLQALYTQGQNWSSGLSTWSKRYEMDWASPDYCKTAFADYLDVFLTGTYLEKIWGLEDNESIEYGLARSMRDVNGACKVYGSLYALNYKDFDDAVYLCLRDSEGLMVFDIVQVIQYSLWDEIKSGIDRAETEAAHAAENK